MEEKQVSFDWNYDKKLHLVFNFLFYFWDPDLLTEISLEENR